jgi:hypothetical protein
LFFVVALSIVILHSSPFLCADSAQRLHSFAHVLIFLTIGGKLKTGDIIMSYRQGKVSEGKMLYHLTALDNMESIIKNGLLCRETITPITDVADEEIIEKRKALGLLSYVPFHFFVKNPFDGAVIKAHPETKFVYLTVYRSDAQKNKWKIIPQHPLKCNRDEIYDYNDGSTKMNWGLIDKRDYSDPDCKFACMAECLVYQKLEICNIRFIDVKEQSDADFIKELFEDQKAKQHPSVRISPNFFVGGSND